METMCTQHTQVTYLIPHWISTSPRRGSTMPRRGRGLPLIRSRTAATGISIHFSLHVVKLSIAFCIDHQVVPLKAGVIDHIVPAVYSCCFYHKYNRKKKAGEKLPALYIPCNLNQITFHIPEEAFQLLSDPPASIVSSLLFQEAAEVPVPAEIFHPSV